MQKIENVLFYMSIRSTEIMIPRAFHFLFSPYSLHSRLAIARCDDVLVFVLVIEEISSHNVFFHYFSSNTTSEDSHERQLLIELSEIVLSGRILIPIS